jgi:ABC-type uncharacterized transport system permease subunit
MRQIVVEHLFGVIALVAWRFGVRHYTSTGS